MKVILLKSVKGIGQKDDVKEVKDGYGTNFLVARGLAVMVTPQVLAEYESRKKNTSQHHSKLEKDALALKEKIEGMILNAELSASDSGAVFGSLGVKEVTGLLKAKDINIDKSQIKMNSPIKKIGESKIQIDLYKDISAELKINVEKAK